MPSGCPKTKMEKAEPVSGKGAIMKRIISVLLIMMILFVPVSFAESDLKSELRIEAAGDGIVLKGTPTSDGMLSKGDYLSFLVIKPGYEFETLSSDEEIESALCYMETKVSPPTQKEFAFGVKFNDDMPYGIYTLKLTVLKSDGTDYVAEYRYNRAAPEEVLGVVNKFKTSDKDSFSIITEEYIFDNLMMDVSDVPELAELKNKIGESFVLVRDGLNSGEIEGEIAGIEKLEDVKYCIKAAMALYSVLESGNENIYKKYASLLPEFFDSDIDVKEVNEIYKSIAEKNDSDSEKLRKVRLANALSYIKDGSYADVAYAIETYNEVLGADLDYLKENNVTASDVARYINTKDITIYKDGIGEAIKEIVAKINKSEKDSGSDKKGGSGGGGSKGSQSVTYPTEETTTPEQIVPEIKDEFIFEDLENAGWAKEQIMNLYKQGIINGVSETRFEPDRDVTREEFVKLCVASFDLKHIDKEAVEFTDCKETDWFYPYVQIAYSHGLINGMGDGSFGAGQAIKREDAAVICLKLLELAGKLPTVDRNKEFADNGEISDYAKLAVMSLSEVGVINGFEDGTFKPRETTTRAQTAVIIERLMSLK